MKKKSSSFLVRNIPPETWSDFKVKSLLNKEKSYNDTLLNLITRYANEK